MGSGCLSRIHIFSIPDTGSNNNEKERGGNFGATGSKSGSRDKKKHRIPYPDPHHLFQINYRYRIHQHVSAGDYGEKLKQHTTEVPVP